MARCKVLGRHFGPNGEVTGPFHENPLLNTIVYDVEFPDGAVCEYSANVIAQNVYSNLDEDGHFQHVFDCIEYYSKDDQEIPMKDKYIITKQVSKRLRKTTVGWKLLVRWKDNSTDWVTLKIMKESYPVQVSEFAVDNNLVLVGPIHITKTRRYLSFG